MKAPAVILIRYFPNLFGNVHYNWKVIIKK
jgi:hypothetical protein